PLQLQLYVLLDVVRHLKIGLTSGQGHDVATLPLELNGPCGESEGCGGTDCLDSARQLLRHFWAPWGGPNLRRSASSTLGGTSPATSPPSRATSRTKRLEM